MAHSHNGKEMNAKTMKKSKNGLSSKNEKFGVYFVFYHSQPFFLNLSKYTHTHAVISKGIMRVLQNASWILYEFTAWRVLAPNESSMKSRTRDYMTCLEVAHNMRCYKAYTNIDRAYTIWHNSFNSISNGFIWQISMKMTLSLQVIKNAEKYTLPT